MFICIARIVDFVENFMPPRGYWRSFRFFGRGKTVFRMAWLAS
jgi:hypothetical protein